MREPTEKSDYSAARLWRMPLFRDVFWLLLLALVVWLVTQMWQVFFPVALGLLLAYLCYSPIVFLESRYKVAKKFSALGMIVLTMLALLGFFVWLGPTLSEQVQLLVERVPRYLAVFEERTGVDVGKYIELDSEFLESESSWLKHAFTNSPRIWGVIRNVLSKATYVGFMLVLVPVYWYVFAVNFDRIIDFFRQFVPASKRLEVDRVVKKMDRVVTQFFRGRLMISVIMGAMFSIGWMLVDVPYWFLLGMVTGVLAIIPYVSAVGWPVAVALKYAEFAQNGGGDISFMSIVFWPSFVYGVVQFFEGWFLTPWIQGEQTDMSVAAVLISVFIGGYIGGIFGLLLAIPVAACLKILFQETILPSMRRWAETH